MKLPLQKPAQMKGGEIVSRLLSQEGVEHAFGIIDGTYFGMYSTFGAHGISLVTPRHETSALHAAAAYARLTGKLGVAMASNGPGVANALPGVAVENAEGNRVLLITSARRHGIIRPDRGGTYQCFPQQEAIAAMSKWSAHVPSVDRLAELTQKALRACFTGRPGVVHLDVPEDIMNGAVDENPAWFRAPEAYRNTERLEPSPTVVRKAAALLRDAKRPLLHVGSGVIHAQAMQAVHTLAATLQAPMVTSWAARAAIDERDPLSVPMLYVDAVNEARNEADVVLVLGSRLGETDWWGKKPYWAGGDAQKLVQVDLDPEVLGNIRGNALHVQADIGAFLEALQAELGRHEAPKARTEWAASLKKACEKRQKELDKHLEKDTMPLQPAHVPVLCQKVMGDDAICIIDGGNTAIWTTFFTQSRRPGSMLSTPKMGMLGAGCAQVLGAKVAFPDRPVYAVIGDGAMGFHPQEVESAVRHGLNVIWVVMADKQWGMVKINQSFALKPIKTLVMKSLGPDETISTDLGEIQWDALARSMGAYGERVSDKAGLEGALRRAVASGKPAVIHVDVDPVAHMWAPNLKTFKDMHQEPAGK